MSSYDEFSACDIRWCIMSVCALALAVFYLLMVAIAPHGGLTRLADLPGQAVAVQATVYWLGHAPTTYDAQVIRATRVLTSTLVWALIGLWLGWTIILARRARHTQYSS